MLGIIIGVASVVVIMALGQGLTKQITDMFSADTRDVQIYYVTKDSDSDSFLMIRNRLRKIRGLRFKKNGSKRLLRMCLVFKIIM